MPERTKENSLPSIKKKKTSDRIRMVGSRSGVVNNF